MSQEFNHIQISPEATMKYKNKGHYTPYNCRILHKASPVSVIYSVTRKRVSEVQKHDSVTPRVSGIGKRKWKCFPHVPKFGNAQKHKQCMFPRNRETFSKFPPPRVQNEKVVDFLIDFGLYESCK